MDLYRTESCGGVLLRIEFPNFRWPNCNGSNCSEAYCQEPSCPRANLAEHLHKADLSRAFSSEPSFPNTKCWKNISRKVVHVVILGLTIAYVRWCIDYGIKSNDKIYRYKFGKTYQSDELKSISKDGARFPKKWYVVSRTRYETSRPDIKRFWHDDWNF